MPITKHNFFVNKIEELADTLRKAFEIAQSGRKGPVLVDITKDVTAATIDYEPGEPLPLRANPAIDDADVAEIAAMINAAKQPVIYAGGGVILADAAQLAVELAEKADIPVVHTLMATGMIGYDHELSLGLVGMHGSVASNRAIHNADLILSLGARFSDRVAQVPNKWGMNAKIVQVDIDNSEINKNLIVEKSCVGDVKEFLEKVIPQIEETKHEEWLKRVSDWRENCKVTQNVDAPLHPEEIINIISDNTDDETIYVTDVGQHQMWAAMYLKHKKAKKFITSGGLGTMGFGYGAAIGSQIGCPDKKVIHITGDGSFQMNLNEVVTAVSNNLPIITVVINNSVLGMVYQWQTLLYDKRYSTTDHGRQVDYVKVAEGFGAKGYRATTPEEFDACMKQAMQDNCPVWIEAVISREERVLPFIPGGKTVEDMIID